MITILVPVLGRPHLIEPLLESIDAATDVDHHVVFICSPGDPATKVCMRSSADTIVVNWQPDKADFARKINLAYASYDDDWFFQAATDLVFHPGWSSTALSCAQRSRVGVIGTNDLGNPAVKKGQQSTHILFSRDYIETFGGTFDGTGLVFSEEYDHQFVDTEFVLTANMRRQFFPCLSSIVEHMHPAWGKGEMDATYEKSERSFAGDREIYTRRIREMRRQTKSQLVAERRRRRAPR